MCVDRGIAGKSAVTCTEIDDPKGVARQSDMESVKDKFHMVAILA